MSLFNPTTDEAAQEPIIPPRRGPVVRFLTAKQSAARTAARGDGAEDVYATAAKKLQVYANRLRAAGEGGDAAKAEEAADKATRLLEEAATLQAEVEQRPTPFVADGVRAAATELRKKLPTVFPCEEDAQTFAAALPLTAARAAAAADHDRRHKKSRAARAARAEAARILDKAARQIYGRESDAESVRDLAKLQ